MVKKALVVVDVQKYYMNEHTRGLPEDIAYVIEQGGFDFVIFTKFVNDEKSSLTKFFNWRELSTSPDCDIVDVLEKYTTDENVFVKNTYSIFKSKGFVRFLEDNGIEELYFCGLDADACVLASAYEGFDMGYRVKVLDDITLSHCGREFEESAFKILDKNLPFE